MYDEVKQRNTEMDVKELNLEELQHEHPLTLVDLQLMHRDYEEDDEGYDENDLITKQNFECICNMCRARIDWYHRYYYKCSISSCYYSLHKFCKDMPTTLQFQGHPSHTLNLKKTTTNQKCHGCLKYNDGMCYHCSTCNYGIDLHCATFVEQNTIHHPSHPHTLICVTVEPGLIKCIACGKKHEGHLYQCTTCFNFSINSNCLSLPIKLSLQTQEFTHRHLLTLSYSFQDRLYDIKCRICGKQLEEENFIYMCSKCMYYVHTDCATQRTEHFTSIFLPGLGKTKKNFKDDDHPKLLHFPLPDDDESHILWDQTDTIPNNDPLKKFKDFYGHDHSVILVNNDTTTSRVSLHDPMKRIKLLCTGCSRPITKFPFYKCSIDDDDDSCDFVLHDWCAQLPLTLRDYVGHPEHSLYLCAYPFRFGFSCRICGLLCTGFFYFCFNDECNDYAVDVNCAFIPREITHEAHANHLLARVDNAGASSSSHQLVSKIECRACGVSIDEGEIYFSCGACDFYLDCRCALYLTKTIKHKFDKHPLKLSYSPIEDHKIQYFCEVCEEDLDPGKWFYHCEECAQSIHTACAPLILQSEQGVNSLYVEGVYKFINIKFGLVYNIMDFHQHPLSFVPGTENDGLCPYCRRELHASIICKCLHCNFACHYLGLCRIQLPDARLVERKIQSFWGIKSMIESRPQRNIEFYPSQMMRPITCHWEVVD